MKNQKMHESEPQSISAYDRNERIYETLRNMGLVVIPMFKNQDSVVIDHFVVSSGIPHFIRNQGQDQG